MNKLIQVLTAISVVGLLASCEKKDVDIVTPSLYSDNFGKHTKELTIYDEAKENSAVLLVGSDDKSILDMWQSENFRLIVSKNMADADATENLNTIFSLSLILYHLSIIIKPYHI